MLSKQLIRELKSLVHLEIDAIRAYERAIERISVADARERLDRFRADHQRHIEELSAVIRRHGGEPPAYEKTAGALQAVLEHEKLTSGKYEETLSLKLPMDVRMIVEKNREDERRHLEYLENAVLTRAWEREPKAA